MPTGLTPLLELAREQLGADVVLAFRWVDDGGALASVSLPASVATATGPVGRRPLLPLSRPAIEAAGAMMLEPSHLRELVSGVTRDALGAPARAAAVIAAAPAAPQAGDDGGDEHAGHGRDGGAAARSAGGLLAVWLAGDMEPPVASDSAAAAAAERERRLAHCAPLLGAALGAVFASTMDALSAEQLSVRLVAMMSAIPQAVVLVDEMGDDSAVNHAAAALLGLESGSVPTAVLAGRMELLQRSLENEDAVRERMGELLRDPDAQLEGWIWQFARPTRRSFRVDSVPVRAPGLRGRLWTFDDVTREVDAERTARENEARFRALSTSAPIGIFQFDDSGRMIYANPRLQEIWEMSGDEMYGHGWTARVHPDDVESLVAVRDSASDPTREYEVDYRLVMPDGRTRFVQGQMALLQKEGGEVNGGVGTVKDVTVRQATERALAESEERLRLALEAAHMSAWDLDLRPAAMRDSAPAAASQVASGGEMGPAFVGDTPHAYESYTEFLRTVHPADRERVDRAAARALSRRRDFEDEFRVIPEDGEIRWRYMKGRMMLALDGTPERMVGISVDSTERKTLEEELTRRAYHDSLTGLANRARFRERVERLMSGPAASTDEWPISGEAQGAAPPNADGEYRGPAVLYIDLDGFKAVNDSLGHDAGDRLLVLVASRLLSATRGSDTTARLGGDEFAILLDHVDSHDDARIVATRVVEAVGAPFNVDGQEVRVGASVGVAVATEGDDADSLLRNADLAMYRAKSVGKGRYAIYVPELQAAAAERLELETELPGAIERGEFRLVYQPIVELATGRVRGAEALVRWDHRERGLIAPLTFIPLAEATGDIVPLGRWILAEACREAMSWERGTGAAGSPDGDAPRDDGRLTIAVNVSARQLADSDFLDTLATVLRESGLPPRMLVLEVTERSLLADSGVVVERLQAVRELGVRLAIDDFGTGFSSLTYLQRSPFDMLRIDHTFTDDLHTADRRPALASAVIALADALSMRTVAEGIESVAQRDALIALGCSLGQGDLYSTPLGAEAFREYVRGAT
jgi:diguanylate cyclase (GGDEF)-like protein/PAS domain S-box-containing protein